MGSLRFRKRLKIAPGLHANLSLKRGVSLSIGGPGASHNIGLDGQQRSTVGLPGSGLSYTHSHPSRRRQSPSYPLAPKGPTPSRHASGSAWLRTLLGLMIALVIVVTMYLLTRR